MAIESFNFFYGIGVPTDEKRAMELCLKSSEKGNKLALSFKKFFGWNTEKDIKSSFELLNEMLNENDFSCVEEYSHCLNLVAFNYKHGENDFIEKNIEKSIELFEKAI